MPLEDHQKLLNHVVLQISQDTLKKSKRHSELCVLLSFSLLFITALFMVFYPDPRIDPKRTDHAVQAGIRECERTLPRTQTCELSQLSFKVVEKK